MDAHTALHWIHVLVLGPLLIAIGRGAVDAYTWAVAALGAFVTVYHAWRGYGKYAAGGIPWVNAIHALVVGPAIFAKGYLGAEAPRWIGEVILMLGFAAIGYHAYYLIVPA
jgi:hypothetical protein